MIRPVILEAPVASPTCPSRRPVAIDEVYERSAELEWDSDVRLDSTAPTDGGIVAADRPLLDAVPRG